MRRNELPSMAVRFLSLRRKPGHFPFVNVFCWLERRSCVCRTPSWENGAGPGAQTTSTSCLDWLGLYGLGALRVPILVKQAMFAGLTGLPNIVLRFLFVCAIRFVCCFMPGMYLVFANYFFSLRIHLTPGSAYFSSVLCFIFVIPFSFLGWYIFLGFGFVSFFFPFSFYGFHYMFFFCVSLFFVVRFSVFQKISGLLACVYLACWRAYVVVPVVSSKMTWDFVVHSTSALECKYLCVVVCYHRA